MGIESANRKFHLELTSLVHGRSPFEGPAVKPETELAKKKIAEPEEGPVRGETDRYETATPIEGYQSILKGHSKI